MSAYHLSEPVTPGADTFRTPPITSHERRMVATSTERRLLGRLAAEIRHRRGIDG
jgi:hypothetical protein